MSRPIKFRAWDTILKKMMNMQEIERSGMNLFVLCEGVKIVTLMQYTGLCDCKGKEIYEGDIVRLTNLSLGQYSPTERYVNDEVVFVNGQFTTRNWDLQQSRCEVIGNVYENPELLKGEGTNE